jgi:hypothetical protein
VSNSVCDGATPDVVGCWDFEVDLKDESTYMHSSFEQNVTRTGGKDSGRRAAWFGTTSRFEIPDDAALDVLDITIEALVRVDAVGGTERRVIVDKNGAWAIHVTPTREVECVFGGTSIPNPRSTAGSIAQGDWTHLACTWDGADAKLYIDGVVADEQTGNGDLAATPDELHLGDDSPSGADQFVGAIDSLRIWRIARPAADICAASGAPGC